MITISMLRKIAEETPMAEGSALSIVEETLIAFGMAVSVTALDPAAIEATIAAAFAAGATTAQIQEVASLISGLGVHSLMASAVPIMAAAARSGSSAEAPLTADQRALWDRHVGDDPFWTGFNTELPGFLEAMLRLSSDQFEAFFVYCAVPWKSGTVRAKLKELIAMASDATPTHRFLPGFRLHLANAVALGAGRREIIRALEIAAAAPTHRGTAL